MSVWIKVSAIQKICDPYKDSPWENVGRISFDTGLLLS